MFKSYPLAVLAGNKIEETLKLGYNFVSLDYPNKKIVYIPSLANDKAVSVLFDYIISENIHHAVETNSDLLNSIDNPNNFIIVDFSDEMVVGDLNKFSRLSTPVNLITCLSYYNEDYLKKQYNFSNIFQINSAGMRTLRANKSSMKTYVNKKILQVDSCSKIATLHCAKGRPSRLMILNYFTKENLLKDCHYTFFNASQLKKNHVPNIFTVTKDYYPNLINDKTYWDNNVIENLVENPVYNDTMNHGFYKMSENHAVDSYFHIVLETDCFSPIFHSHEDKEHVTMCYNLFPQLQGPEDSFKENNIAYAERLIHKAFAENSLLTEKTFKAFCMLHPFIIYAAQGHIQDLRDRGYDVFDDIIDHSYNEKITMEDNMKLFLQEASRLINLGHNFWKKYIKDNINRLYNNYELFESTMSSKQVQPLHNELHKWFKNG